MRIGVYPGTFDPITLGHMDIIRRGAKLVDRLVIGVTTNITKSPLFDDDERIEMVRREVAGLVTDGVMREPEELMRTLGVAPSMTATQEFVVPRSMPMILDMVW